jgi:hypothetical protein
MGSKLMRVGVAILAIIVLGSFALLVNGRFEWNRYMVEHHCRPTGHIYTRYSTQTVYRCDKNEIIVRH